MAANPPGQGFQNKNRVAILAELDKEKRKLLMQNQSSTNHPGASIALARSSLNKDFRDHAEQQHIAAQQKAALQTGPLSDWTPAWPFLQVALAVFLNVQTGHREEESHLPSSPPFNRIYIRQESFVSQT
ncbi:SOSS complex subunit C isoform X2 [Mauremys mutica]|uniref:SOSS complex subunit C isoform X2 n=1 Tax=Mauremys mutica TaxID=74926 RepID=UPI001D162814|nr:SOSS complex subunit C isoform X2 [Mauremys mutica]